MTDPREIECARLLWAAKTAAGKLQLAETFSQTFKNPLSGMTLLPEELGFPQLLWLPVLWIFIALTALFIPLMYVAHHVRLYIARRELRKKIDGKFDASIYRPPSHKTLGALWESYELTNAFSADDSLELLKAWIVTLYGQELASSISVETQLQAISKRQAQANLPFYEDRSAPHFHFIPPIRVLIRKLTEELPPYDEIPASQVKKDPAPSREKDKPKSLTGLEIIKLYLAPILPMIRGKCSDPRVRAGIQVFILGMVDMLRQIHHVDWHQFASTYSAALSVNELSPSNGAEAFAKKVGAMASVNTTIEKMMQQGAHSIQRYVAEQDSEAPTDLIGAALFAENNAADFECLLDSNVATDDVDRECQQSPPRERSEFVVTLQKFINAAQACAQEYFGNAEYIENELPKITMTESLLQMTLRICKSLKSVRDDIFAEFQSWKQGSLSQEQIAEQAIVVKNILAKDLQDLHVLVMSIRSQAEADSHKFGRANLLVGESATNIYEEFTCFSDIAKELEEASKRT